jgi:hypothetical protein
MIIRRFINKLNNLHNFIFIILVSFSYFFSFYVYIYTLFTLDLNLVGIKSEKSKQIFDINLINK